MISFKGILPKLIRPRPPELTTRYKRRIPKLIPPVPDFVNQFELPRIHFKPIDGIDFDKAGVLAIAAANTVYTDVINFQIPVGYEGVIKQVGIGTSVDSTFFVKTTGGLYRILINGVPAMDWSDIFIHRGGLGGGLDASSATGLLPPAQVTIFLPTGCLLQFQASTTASLAAATVTARLVGWYWIQKDVKFAGLG